MSKSTFTRLLVATTFAFASGFATAASSQVVAETDCWVTDPGTMAAIPPLPADFFGPGSDPLPGGLIPVVGVPLTPVEEANCGCPPAPGTQVVFVDIHGDPVPAGSIHAVNAGPTPDTCIRRLSGTNFPGGPGVPVPIAIELVELSLQSAAPIQVTFGGSPTFWDVFITEDGVQAPGQMVFTPTIVGPGAAGEVTVPNLPIDFQFRFEPVLTGPPPVFLNGNVNMQNPNPQSPGPPGTFQVLAGVGVPVLPDVWVFLLAGTLFALGAAWLRRRQTA